MSVHLTKPASLQIYLDINWDNTGNPTFFYFDQPPWVLANGTIDLTHVNANVLIAITLVSAGHETFADPTIGFVHHVGNQDPPCPVADSHGIASVFHDLTLSGDSRTFSFRADNGNHSRYFYSLWFNKPGMPSFCWDPIIINK